ncbi:tetratricopeptide repeat protein [Pseudonocardia sp. ICBG1122]|nr:tetratricopeptide repeat protein [Pseudonocardia pini]
MHESVHVRSRLSDRTVERGVVVSEIADLVLAGDLRVTPDGDLVPTPHRKRSGPSDRGPAADVVLAGVGGYPVPFPLWAWIDPLGPGVAAAVRQALLRDRVLASGAKGAVMVVDHERGCVPGLRLRAMVRRPDTFTLRGAIMLTVLCAVGAESLLAPQIAEDRSRRLDGLLRAVLPEPVRHLLDELRELAGGRGRVVNAHAPPTTGPGAPASDSARVFAGSPLLRECATFRRRDEDSRRAVRSGLRDRHDRVAVLIGQDPVHRIAGALPELFDVVRTAATALGRLDPDTLVAEGSLALAYLSTGQQERGVALLRRNRAARESVFGADHPLSLVVGDEIAAARLRMGQVGGARSEFEAMVRHRTRVFGAVHPSTVVSRAGLASAVRAAGDFSTAAASAATLLRIVDAALGHDHPVVSHVADVLEDCLAASAEASGAAGDAVHPPADDAVGGYTPTALGDLPGHDDTKGSDR